MMDQSIENATGSSGLDCERVCVTHLSQHLGLADDHRIERRSNAKEVSHGFFISVTIEMLVEKPGG
jgi:hypothetical protein